MRLSGFNLNQVVCLEALLLEGNVTKAAERVHLSQSAMSAILAELRDHFGDALLVRSGRKMMLTPFARGLIAPVSELLARAQAFAALRPGQESPDIARELTLVASEFVTISCLSLGIQRVMTDMPGLRFNLVALADDSGKMLQNGEIDLLLAGQTLDVGIPPKAQVFSDELVCLTCAGCDPTVGELSAEEYAARDHVVVRFSDGHSIYDDEEAVRCAGVSRNWKIKVWSYLLVPELVCGSSLVATVPKRLVPLFVDRWPLRVHPFPFDHEPVRVFAYWHSSRDGDAILSRFLQSLGTGRNQSENQEIPPLLQSNPIIRW